jgi:hypothetical protein
MQLRLFRLYLKIGNLEKLQVGNLQHHVLCEPYELCESVYSVNFMYSVNLMFSVKLLYVLCEPVSIKL